MSQTKTLRDRKRQLGQFLTPPETARRLLADLPFTRDSRVLEPCFGDGSFLLPLIEKFLPLHDGSLPHRLAQTLTCNVFGMEIDLALHARGLARIRERWGDLPAGHALACGDFFRADLPGGFDYVVGNPPFGGTLAPDLQDRLDRELGWRNGLKIKKETYAFFIVKCLDILQTGGHLRFICSDTFLTINTMQGLRRFLLESGRPSVTRLDAFSEETKYAMVVLDLCKSGPAPHVVVDGRPLARERIARTGNHSWQVPDDLARYFDGPKLSDFLIATSGMTVGANHLFVREITDGCIVEPYEFEFFENPITLAGEVERARLGSLSPKKRAEIALRECAGETRRSARVVPRPEPHTIRLPHPDYRPYNKAQNALVWAPPSHAIFWKDDGDAVMTFRRNGPWYLHGVGGRPFFGREGFTWQLIAPTLNARWLPPGCILDSGAPCAFLRDGVPEDELFFILGWTFSGLCGRLLKDVLNHTRNIQGKDFERLPYPFWVPPRAKRAVTERVKILVAEAQAGRAFRRGDPEIAEVGAVYEGEAGGRSRPLQPPTLSTAGGASGSGGCRRRRTRRPRP